MASLPHFIEFEMKRRPCYVNEKKAMFHKWVESFQQIGNCSVRKTLGLIEYEDGTVKEEDPNHIRFADGGDFEKISWRHKENDN